MRQFHTEMQSAEATRLAFDALPDGAYDVIVCDPPWQYHDSHTHPIGPDYPTMTMDDICAIDVRRVARRPRDGGSILFMWTTGPMIGAAIALARQWGFSFRTVFLVWIKCTKRDTLVALPGAYTMSATEYLIVCTRGRAVSSRLRRRRNLHQVLRATRTLHSAKPAEAMERIEAWLGLPTAEGRTDAPRCLEMFARSTRPGWEAWGNDPALLPQSPT